MRCVWLCVFVLFLLRPCAVVDDFAFVSPVVTNWGTYTFRIWPGLSFYRLLDFESSINTPEYQVLFSASKT